MRMDGEREKHVHRTGAQADFRALMMLDHVPPGHVAVPIMHARWAPHLQPGEFAVLDVTDTEPQIGEMFGLMIGSPYRSALAGNDAVMFRFAQRRPGALLTADGPLGLTSWAQSCRGRVVGVLTLADGEVDDA